MKYEEILESAKILGEAAELHDATASKLLSGWGSVNNRLLDEFRLTIWHVGWDLADLVYTLPEISGSKIEEIPRLYDRMYYPDFEALTQKMLTERTVQWYRHVHNLQIALDNLLDEVGKLGGVPRIVKHVNSRLWRDLSYLKPTLKKALGVELED